MVRLRVRGCLRNSRIQRLDRLYWWNELCGLSHFHYPAGAQSHCIDGTHGEDILFRNAYCSSVRCRQHVHRSLCLCTGWRVPKREDRHVSLFAESMSQSNTVYPSVLGVQMAGIGLAFNWPSRGASPPVLRLSKATKRRAKNMLGVLSVISLLATLYRWPTEAPRPHRPGPRILRAGIWTVHFGIDNEGRDSQRRMRDLIGFVL